jgi:transcriptional regulator with XRE-family HTH domain
MDDRHQEAKELANDLRKRLGERIRILRKSKRLSQEKLGELAGLHYTYIGAVERGERNVSIDSLGKIARGLGIGIEELFVWGNYQQDRDDRSSILREIGETFVGAERAEMRLVADIARVIVGQKG